MVSSAHQIPGRCLKAEDICVETRARCIEHGAQSLAGPHEVTRTNRLDGTVALGGPDERPSNKAGMVMPAIFDRQPITLLRVPIALDRRCDVPVLRVSNAIVPERLEHEETTLPTGLYLPTHPDDPRLQIPLPGIGHDLHTEP